MKSSWAITRELMRSYVKLSTAGKIVQRSSSYSFGTLKDSYERTKAQEGELIENKNLETETGTKQNFREEFKDKISRNDAYPPESAHHSKLDSLSAPSGVCENHKESSDFRDYHDYNVRTFRKIIDKGREPALEEEGKKVEATLMDKARQKVKQKVKSAMDKEIRDPLIGKNDSTFSSVDNSSSKSPK